MRPERSCGRLRAPAKSPLFPGDYVGCLGTSLTLVPNGDVTRGVPTGAIRYWLELVITPLVSLLGIFIAAAGIYLSVRSNNDTERIRERVALEVQRDQQAAAFELAAAQIVMSQGTCKLARIRAAELVKLFPSRLETPLFKRLTRQYPTTVCSALKQNPPSLQQVLVLSDAELRKLIAGSRKQGKGALPDFLPVPTKP
jgi:hypothetical protein